MIRYAAVGDDASYAASFVYRSVAQQCNAAWKAVNP